MKFSPKKIINKLIFGILFSGSVLPVLSAEKKQLKINNVEVPFLGASHDSVHVVWDSVGKRGSELLAADYVVFLDGKKLSQTARQNSENENKNVAGYTKSFNSYFTKKLTGLNMVKTDVTFYHIKNLSPETDYSVKVCAVDTKGRIIASSEEISVRTTKSSSAVLDVTKYGAVSTDKMQTFDEENKEIILRNTQAIQTAIDECPDDGIVYIPYGLYMCGALHLKSNMTLKIDGELCGSPFAEHYDFGFLMYKYYTDNRYFGLLNADGAENLTICGSGLVDGNGWKFEGLDSYPTFDWRTYAEEGDPDPKKYGVLALVKYMKGNHKSATENGILAASCVETFLKKQRTDVKSAEDSLLREAYASRGTTVILRNVKGLFISGLTFVNPANHVINILDSENISVTGINELSYDCNNGDGIGLICSQNAYIWNNLIDTGDDSIVFSSGVGKSAYTTGEKGVENVKIFGNYIHHGHGGVAFGSHTALGIKNIEVRDNIFNHTDTPFRVKSAPANGGEVSNVRFYDNSIAYCKDGFSLSTDYNDAGTVSKYGAADKMAVFHDIAISNCTVYNVKNCSIIVFAKEGGEPHHSIVFEDVNFSGLSEYARKPRLINCKDIVIK